MRNLLHTPAAATEPAPQPTAAERASNPTARLSTVSTAQPAAVSAPEPATVAPAEPAAAAQPATAAALRIAVWHRHGRPPAL